MKYISLVGTEGAMPAGAVETMNREWPAFEAELASRGVQLFGRELEFPDRSVTVRVRVGETLVSDGPFAETKEFVGGLELLECADMDEAVEITTRNPVARFNPFEIRPVHGEPFLSDQIPAFAQADDRAGNPFLLIVWSDSSLVSGPEQEPLTPVYQAWCRDLQDQGMLIAGCRLAAPGAAVTLRPSGGEIRVSNGPLAGGDSSIIGVDVIRCTDRTEAVRLAATHPFARTSAIEVRPFHRMDEAPA